MTGDLPDPPIPSGVDLSDFAFTPIFRARLFGSRFHARVSDAEWRAGVTLWLKSWDQVPAGSLPDDDIDLCRLAELGRDIKLWRKIRAGALHGWYKCSDGLLYHRVVAEGVNDALGRKHNRLNRGLAGANAKWGREGDAEHKKRHERLAEARTKGTHSEAEWAELIKVCGNRCVRCGLVGRPVKDHITPIYQGGSDAIDNLQPLCRSCNSAKGPDRTDYRPDDWRLRLGSSAASETPTLVCGMPAGMPAEMPASCLQMPGNRQGQGQGQGQGQKERSSLPSEARPPPDASDDAETEISRPEVEQAFAAWNALASQCGLPRAHRLDEGRRKCLAARLRENRGIAGWLGALEAIRGSPFLLGQEHSRDGERSWNASLDWLLKPSNFRKVAEGNYAAKAPAMSRSQEAARAIYEALVPNGTPPPHACDPDAITLQPSEWMTHEP